MKFDSSQIDVQANLTVDGLVGLTTRNDGVADNGHIKVRVDAGTLRINEAVDVDARGDVLLRAYGPASDVLVDATVTSDAGDVTLFAADDVVTTRAIVRMAISIFVLSTTMRLALGEFRLVRL